MNPEHALKIDSTLPADALVIDVGGGQAACPRADWIIDAIPFDKQGGLLRADDARGPARFSRDTWVQFDLCSREKWPFDDNQFDFAVCSHVLEDVRDPIWVCSEISRIAKAGYIEVPSRVVEQSKGIEHPRYAGYYHHRWLVSVHDGQLEFRHKPHLLHVNRDAIVSNVGLWQAINPKYEIETHYWDRELKFEERLEFDEQKVLHELCDCASRARKIPDLLCRPQESIKRRLRRAYYFSRLRLAGR